ncbi:hypothetical protein Tco_0046035 [Tanacetum coccineum]
MAQPNDSHYHYQEHELLLLMTKKDDMVRVCSSKGVPKNHGSENGVPYQLHVTTYAEPYHFKDMEKTKWTMSTSDIDRFCNGGELPGMVRVGSMTYFQDQGWYDELADGKLKDETLALKAKIEGSWGDATSGL